MPDVVLISDLTWRSLEMQKEIYPNMPYFIGPGEIPTMLRQSQRAEPLHIYMVSLGVAARKEEDFRDFLIDVKKRKAFIHSKEECLAVAGTTFSIDKLVLVWRKARKKGAAKIGGRISADKRKAESKIACEKIKDIWPLPSSEYTIKKCERISGIARGTIVSILGLRKIAQHNYQAKLKRKVNANR